MLLAYDALHVLPQLILPSFEVTVPVPVLLMVSVYDVGVGEGSGDGDGDGVDGALGADPSVPEAENVVLPEPVQAATKRIVAINTAFVE